MYKFAFTIENDVFYVLSVDDSSESGLRWIAALKSSPYFVKADNYPLVHFSCLWDGEKFYPPNDINKQYPYDFEEKDPLNKDVKFAGVIDGEVFGLISFFQDVLGDQMLEAISIAMSLNPIIVECSVDQDVEIGYTWDGTNFKKQEINNV